jgi:hypothetical protein
MHGWPQRHRGVRSVVGRSTPLTRCALPTPQSCPPAGGRSILTVGQARRRAAHPEGSNGEGDDPDHRWPGVQRVAHHPGAAGPERGVRARPAPRYRWIRRICQRGRQAGLSTSAGSARRQLPTRYDTERAVADYLGWLRAGNEHWHGSAAADPVIRRGHHARRSRGQPDILPGCGIYRPSGRLARLANHNANRQEGER